MVDATMDTGTTRSAQSAHRGLVLVLVVVTLYALLHAGFRLAASHVLGEDDVVDIVLAQDLRAGYDAFPRQPPLYNWVLWAVEQVFGPRFENFLLIKYAALVASAGFLYLAARRALGDRLFALLTVESMALIYSISWRYHEGFTHEVGAMVAVLATTWLMLRVLQEGRTGDYLGLAVAMGLGFLTEPAYTVFLGTLILAAAWQPATRPALLRTPLLLAFLAALAIASPTCSGCWTSPGAWRGFGASGTTVGASTRRDCGTPCADLSSTCHLLSSSCRYCFPAGSRRLGRI